MVLARFLCQAAEGDSVHINIIAPLARLSTKIKVVSADLRKFARISLNLKSTPDPRFPADSDDANLDDKTNLIRTYCEKCVHYHRSLAGLLEEVLKHFQGMKPPGMVSPSYEISAVVYDTGFETFQTLVSQDEEHSFAGSSDDQIINLVHGAFHMVSEVAKGLAQQVSMDRLLRDSQDANSQQSVGTAIF